MARTNYPKYASYTGDGSGRDAYVILNNGGLTSVSKANMMFRKQSQPKYHNPAPQKHATSITYISDGTGRDSYVISNSGGLVNDFKCTPVHAHFLGSLRRQERTPLPPKFRGLSGPPDITDYLHWITPNSRKEMARRAKHQRELDARLSPPRFKRHDFETLPTNISRDFTTKEASTE
jgi:hypothetical protein